MMELVSIAAWGGIVLTKLDVPEGTVNHGEHTLKQWKNLRRKEQKRDTPMY